jgi:hypothetical protein
VHHSHSACVGISRAQRGWGIEWPMTIGPAGQQQSFHLYQSKATSQSFVYRHIRRLQLSVYRCHQQHMCQAATNWVLAYPPLQEPLACSGCHMCVKLQTLHCVRVCAGERGQSCSEALGAGMSMSGFVRICCKKRSATRTGCHIGWLWPKKIRRQQPRSARSSKLRKPSGTYQALPRGCRTQWVQRCVTTHPAAINPFGAISGNCQSLWALQ